MRITREMEAITFGNITCESGISSTGHNNTCDSHVIKMRLQNRCRIFRNVCFQIAYCPA